MNESRPKNQARVVKDLLRLIGVAAFFVGAALLLKSEFVRGEIFDLDHLRLRFRQTGWEGQLLFVAVAAGINALGVPRIWVCAVAGSLYGAVYGASLALAATLLGSVINFMTGRTLLRGPLKRRMPKRIRPWFDLFNANGFRAILYFRLFPFTNATVTNLLSGASRVSFPVFFGATVLGYLPLTIAFATLGSSAAKQSGLQLGLGIGLLVVMIGGRWLWKREARTAGSSTEDDETGTRSPKPVAVATESFPS